MILSPVNQGFFLNMKQVIASVKVMDTKSSWFGQVVDVALEKGKVLDIAPSLEMEGVKRISGQDLILLPGVVDLGAHHVLPGAEHRESWDTLFAAAKAGGIQHLRLLPTAPHLPEQAEMFQSIHEKGKHEFTQLYAVAPLTQGNRGENFSDLMDLHLAGAKAFSHAASSLPSTDLFLKCIQYLMNRPVSLLSRPNHEGLSLFGQIHEGWQSTLTGLKGIPVLAETLCIKRDLDLLRYALSHDFGLSHPDFRLHFSAISSAEGLQLLREAKVEGLPITVDVSINSLCFTEDAIADFDTHAKLMPPLRTAADQEALWEGILDQTVDGLISDHCPQEDEQKALEFDQAAFGSIGLETLLPAFMEQWLKRKLPKETLQVLNHRAASCLGISLPALEIGQAWSGLLLEQKSWTYSQDNIRSLSKNAIFLNRTFSHQMLNHF